MNAIDLTWLQQVKDFAEVKTVNDDAMIASLITEFSQYCLTHCSRETLNRIVTFNEIYNGNGSYRLYLRNSPIQSLIAVFIDGTSRTLSAGYASPGVFIEQEKRSIAIRGGTQGSALINYYPGPGLPFYFCKGVGNINIQYTAGFPVQTQTNEIETIASQTIPLQFPTWVADLGVVFYPSLVPLVLVPAGPLTGQYAVSNGLYVFAAADNGKQVAVSYTYNSAPADLEFVARRTVAQYYKRRQWLDQASKSLGAQGATGTTRYRDWKMDPRDMETLNNYKRYALTPSGY